MAYDVPAAVQEWANLGTPIQPTLKRGNKGDIAVIESSKIYGLGYTEVFTDGSGQIWYASASRGPTSYTTLYANRHTLVERRPELLAMTRAIYQMQKWLRASDAETVATTIASYFPNIDRETLTGSIDRYKSLGVWSTNPIVSKDGFERLKAACLTGGLIAKAADYDDCVDVELARAVME